MKCMLKCGYRLALTLVFSCLMQLLVLAQTSPVELKLRIVPVNGTSRPTDNNFQMGNTSGFSVVQLNGAYYLYGPSGFNDSAWGPQGSIDSIRFPGALDGWCPANMVNNGTLKPPCDPSILPTQRDTRCGDEAGLFSKSVTSSVPSWLYQDFSTGGQQRLQAFAAPGVWPVTDNPLPPPQGGVCQLNTGISGWHPVITAAAINAAIPSPPALGTPGTCPRDTTAYSLATGAADSKAVYFNGHWYMAFSETVNNPATNMQYPVGLPPNHYGWTPSDLFFPDWAISSDGQTWTVREQLFHSSVERNNCNGGFLVTELMVDNGYFYMLVDEIWGKGLILFRAPVDVNNPNGFDSNGWQLQTQSSQGITWTNVAVGSTIDTSNVSGTGGVQAVSIAPGSGEFVQQGSLQRVYNSAAANSPSQIVLIATASSGTTTVLYVYTAPDFNSPFTMQNVVDTAFIKPAGGNGYEFGFTEYPDQSPSTPRIIGTEFDFWLIGDFSSGPGTDPNDLLGLTAYRTTATLSGAIYSPRAAWRTANGDYLSVTAGNVSASQTTIGAAARFVILDSRINIVQSGDAVNLQARNGNYISATNGGGGTAVAVPGDPGVNETFTIVKVNGSGQIGNGDSVGFKSTHGYYLVAEGGGGGTVDFSSTTINSSSTFVYVAQ